MTAAETAFGIGLYRQLAPARGNLFFSPYSVAGVLTMSLTGARGSTAAEIAGVLHLALPASRIAVDFAGLERQLARAANDHVTLVAANSAWAQPQAGLRTEFLQTLRSDFHAEATAVDFVHAADSARRAINAWVAERTRGKITQLIGPGVLDARTRLVLCNAVYFKGRWAQPFEPRLTTPAPFHLDETHRVDVPTMHRSGRVRTIVADGLRVLELPYAGETLSMVIVLPDARDGLARLDADLTPAQLSAWLARLGAAGKMEVALALPRFSLSSNFNLGGPLQAMGLKAAFDPDTADFSGMTGDRSLCLSDVVHRAVIEVNEEGTVAAAATGAMFKATAVMVPLQVRVDHPFLFLIRDNATGTILFLGRVVDPR